MIALRLGDSSGRNRITGLQIKFDISVRQVILIVIIKGDNEQ